METPQDDSKKLILWFDQISKDDIALVGGKNANLGELYCNLTNATSTMFPNEKIEVPYGFAITSAAYRYFIEKNGLDAKISQLLAGLNTADMHQLAQVGESIRQMIIAATIPADLQEEILKSYKTLSDKFDPNTEVDVAVRSSATAEDLPQASFAGQQESYLNIKGGYALLDSIRRAFASLFTNRAISYRVDQKFDHFKIAISIGVQKMARSDRGSSGVMFTLDTETGFTNAILINSSWGLGEYVVKGIVTPDEFMVFKPSLAKGFAPIINKRLGSKEKKLIYATEGTTPTKEVLMADEESIRFSISDEIVLKLARWGMMIEAHYGHAMDIEWAYDSHENKLYIVQARSETVQTRRQMSIIEEYVLLEKGNVLARGASVGKKIGQGRARFIKDPSQLAEFVKGEVLIAEITDPDWEPIMKIASAIVTDEGGRTSHAAIVSRELGIPAVVGCGNATSNIPTGTDVTVSCSEGEGGVVFEGMLRFSVDKTDISNIKLPKTEIKMIIADPELALEYSFIPNNGVGLAREEFIIAKSIKIHPNALINYDTLKDDVAKKQISVLTAGYSDKREYYLEKLSCGIATIAAAFYPNEVLLRFSDFKTNEYANLIGGAQFEPHEENPMIGWRGSSRYYDSDFSQAFALECIAIKRVREVMGLGNVQILVPFCRTVDEGKEVISAMEKNGLVRGQNGLKVWVMAEIPSNILQAEEFAKIFDGFSIGSNDLTQLTLGLDRDSKIIASIGNENNESVHLLIKMLIEKAHAAGLKVGICGQGPSDFPEFAEFLVRQGIDSISLSPDAVLKTAINVGHIEEKINGKVNYF